MLSGCATLTQRTRSVLDRSNSAAILAICGLAITLRDRRSLRTHYRPKLLGSKDSSSARTRSSTVRAKRQNHPRVVPPHRRFSDRLTVCRER